MPDKYNFGWKRQAFDPRDKYYTVSDKAPITAPAAFDLPGTMPANLDQGSLGSCGPNTAAECIGVNQKVQGQVVAAVSRLFIYYNTRYLMGTVNQDSGVDNRTMMKAIATYGFCEESLWPYDPKQFRQRPPMPAYQAAAKNKITDYAAVIQNLTQMKGCLLSGDGFVFGFDVFEAIQSDEVAHTGIVPMPSNHETPVGGHDVTIFGYDDARQAFHFRNHWRRSDGQWWGENGSGNGWIPYAYATNPKLAGDFWVFTSIPGVNNPQPTPTPTPEPTPTPTPSPTTWDLKLPDGTKSVRVTAL